MPSLIPKGGNDKVYTPDWLAEAIVKHYDPSGLALEPCAGDGAFALAMDKHMGHLCDYCEIDDGIDFFKANYLPVFNWVITNPPWSKFRAFLKESMRVADNVVFLSHVNAFWLKARMRDIKEAGFGIKEIYMVPTPKENWPQSGFQLGATHVQRGWKGPVTISELTQGS